MNIERRKVLDTFSEYTSHYNLADEKIKLKVYHTYRVAALCQRIANSLGLSAEDTDLAWLTGMLHDIGRFEQVKNYNTFSDADSIDHAHYGVQILYDDGKIEDYLPGCQESPDYEIVRTAIWNHSAFRVEEGLDERSHMFCDILRDADKIDILKVNFDTPLEEIYNVTTKELANAPITDAVLEQFKEHHAIIRSTKRTAIDNLVGHIALVFELVYPESLRIVQEQGYLQKLLGFPSENPVTREQFSFMKKEIQEYIDSIKNTADFL